MWAEIGLGAGAAGSGTRRGSRGRRLTGRLCQLGRELTSAGTDSLDGGPAAGGECRCARDFDARARRGGRGALAPSPALADTSLTFTVTRRRVRPPPTRIGPPAGRVTPTSRVSSFNRKVAQLGRPPHARIGTMEFSYTMRKQCTRPSPAASRPPISSASRCSRAGRCSRGARRSRSRARRSRSPSRAVRGAMQAQPARSRSVRARGRPAPTRFGFPSASRNRRRGSARARLRQPAAKAGTVGPSAPESW